MAHSVEQSRRDRSPGDAARAIVADLTAAGHQALLAGGCVRDMLLGRIPKDFDVATSAHPEDIKRVFPRAQMVGAHFGVAIVRRFGHTIEVATFRIDGQYSDGRHPDSVTFTTAEEDARRRDFTINGMFFDVAADAIIDYVGGQADIEQRLIQAIGNPEKRFEEDHLRMLRAVRFATELDFSIEQETYEALYNRSDHLRTISMERTREELERTLAHPRRAAGFQLLADTNLLPSIWPGARWSTQLVQRSYAALQSLPTNASFALAMTAALHHHAPDDVNAIARHLTCSNQQRRNCVWLLRGLAAAWDDRIASLADLKKLMASEFFPGLADLIEACLVADGRPTDRARTLRQRAAAISAAEVAPEPLVGGQDLIDLGLRAGPAFKRILDELYDRQLNLELTDRDQALQLARDMSAKEDPA